jgi:subtilisin family serine protease
VGGTYYYLENYGGFGLGDSVCVSGTLIPGCDSGCVGADGCIAGNSIYGWESDGWPYEQCGVLIQGIDCIVFAPFNDSIVLALDYIGDFSVDDTVCVSGVVDWGNTLGCTGVAGCVLTNSITIRFDFYHDYEVIIKLEEGFTIDPILIDYQAIALDSVIENDLYLVGLGTSYLLESAIESISARPGVIFAQPNYTVGMPETFHVSQSFPDDQHPTLLWGSMPSTYFDASVYTVNSDSANLYTTGLDIVVAVIDNGVDFTHPLLVNSFASTGYDFIDDDNDPSEVEGALKGHGTFVCGIIRRIAPDCSFLPLRVFNLLGYGDSYRIARAIRYAVAQSADIINMSFGNYTSNPVIQEAVNEAVAAGITLVAAVGNAGTSVPSYPAAYPGVIAVSAIDTMEYLADFSNYGEHIDVCAPGVNVYSSLAGEYAGEYEWGTWSGTSFAAPMVTGVCALILSGRNDLTSFEVEELAKLTAEDNLEWGNIVPPSSEYGYGRVDALGPTIDASLGDVNNSQSKNLQDVTYLINMLYYNGPAPIPTEDVGDTDCSDTINLLDIANLIRYLYMGGPAPSCILE